LASSHGWFKTLTKVPTNPSFMYPESIKPANDVVRNVVAKRIAGISQRFRPDDDWGASSRKFGARSGGFVSPRKSEFG